MTNWEMWYHLAGYNWYSRMGMDYPAVWGWVLFWIFAFGACWGSFLNVCIWRIPRGESLSKAASHCTSCGMPIRWFDNLPVLSYLILRGKCRQCHTAYSASYFFVELACGILFVLTVVKTGLLQQTPAIIPNEFTMIFFAVGCALIDIKNRIIPNKMTFSAIIIGILLAILLPQAWGTASRSAAVFYSCLSGIIPAVTVFCFACSGKLFLKRDVIGMGDVKFIMAAGILIGLPGAVFSLFAGSLFCIIIEFAIKKSLKQTTAFGPYLAAGTILWIFAGNYLLDIYYKICTSI